MTRILAVVGGAAMILLYATLLLVVMPAVQLQTGSNPPDGLKPYSDSALRGRDQYIALGCVYCHSQQPRDPSQAPDGLRGWGRPSVPADYSYDTTHLLGTMRTGPDLFNIGSRQPSVDWHMAHLYQPRALVPGSTMPSYPFLFLDTDYVDESQKEVILPPGYDSQNGHIVPTQQAIDLVEYLLALDHTYTVKEIPTVSQTEITDDTEGSK